MPRALFTGALSSGKRLSSAHFTAVVPTVRGYAVVIPKKVARLSVARHQTKRRVLEALRTLPLPKGLIIFPKASAQNLDFTHTQEELANLLSKLS